MVTICKTGIGQDSHRFMTPESSKPCIIGGVIFEEMPGLLANSDGDVVFHALCNAISSLTGVLILGGIADEMCLKDGITDSRAFLEEAVKTLGNKQITHVAITIEANKPHLKARMQEMKDNIASILSILPSQVGITATTGEGLTDFGCGEGVQCFCVISVMETV